MDNDRLRRRPGMTVLAVAALALLAILIAFAVELTRIQGQSRRDVETRFYQRAQVASALTDGLLASVAAPSAQAQNARRFAGHVSTATMKATAAQGHLEFAVLLDPHGRMIAASPGLDVTARSQLLEPRGVARSVLAGRPYALSRVLPDRGVPGGSVVELGQPIRTPGGTRVLVSGFPPAALGDFLHNYLSRVINVSAARAYVLDDRGTVVGGAGPGVAPNAPVPEPGLVAALAHRPQGSFGGDRYLVADGVAQTPWRVVLTAPQSRLFASVGGARKWVPWVIFAAFAGLGILALGLLRGVLASAAGQLRAANSRLQEVNRRLERANRDLAERADDLARSNAELEQFASIASHDLQEPLRKVQTFAGQLASRETDRLSPRGQDYVRRMTAAAARMQALIEDLLKFSRVSTHGRDFVPVDLGDVARQVLDDLEVSVREADAQVRVGPLPTLAADPLQMRQLLQNLISNALKFRRQDAPAEVVVSARASGRWVELIVADNGIGFEPQYGGRIFLVFERLHGAGTYPGTGIGLALCRKIVARHGGQISAEGRPGAGAVFTVRLPRDGGDVSAGRRDDPRASTGAEVPLVRA
jgi:signal transduction histidine kinase